MESQFKKEFDEKTRIEQFDKIKKKFPDKIPIICEKAPKTHLKSIEKIKYLVPKDTKVGEFSRSFRKKIDLNEKEAFYLLVHEGKGFVSITSDRSLSNIYDTYKDKTDGFLYLVYSAEETWG